MTEPLDLLEHLNLRDLPPLEPIPPRKRLSQTLLKNFDRCQRSAYLYVVHDGGLPGVPLDRGTALHMAIARATTTMLVENETRIPHDLAKTILDEVLDEHPELTIPIAEQDDLREMMYHWSQGFRLNLETVAAVERKFVLELDGHTLSGIIDYAEIDGQAATIRDYKSSYALPSEGEYQASFQCAFYAVLLTFGNPVNDDGTLDPPLGDRLTWLDVGELYPRYLRDGELVLRHVGMTRLEVEEKRRDIARLCRRFAAASESGRWPAMSGSHCAECPMESACPLPRDLRNFAGAINTVEEAQEASEWLERNQHRLNATRKEIKLWAKFNGPFRFGRDREWTFESTTTNVTNYETLAAAVELATTLGVPYVEADHRKVRTGTRFVAKTVGREDEPEESE